MQWRVSAAADLSLEFGTKFQTEVPLFLEIPALPSARYRISQL